MTNSNILLSNASLNKKEILNIEGVKTINVICATVDDTQISCHPAKNVSIVLH